MVITVVESGAEILTPIEDIRSITKLLEKAGRTCYKSEEKITEESAEKFVRGIIKSGHESVIEHCSITVRIICSRACSHQLVRHRLAAYSQESQRYCDYGELGLQIIVPPTIGGRLLPGTWKKIPEFKDSVRLVKEFWRNETYFESMADVNETEADSLIQFKKDRNPAFFEFLEQIASSYQTYLGLRERGVPPQDARFVLPNATKTEVVTTYNLRQWRHVFKERALNKHAQWEIRGIMLGLLREFQAYFLPAIFGDLK